MLGREGGARMGERTHVVVVSTGLGTGPRDTKHWKELLPSVALLRDLWTPETGFGSLASVGSPPPSSSFQILHSPLLTAERAWSLRKCPCCASVWAEVQGGHRQGVGPAQPLETICFPRICVVFLSWPHAQREQ